MGCLHGLYYLQPAGGEKGENNSHKLKKLEQIELISDPIAEIYFKLIWTPFKSSKLCGQKIFFRKTDHVITFRYSTSAQPEISKKLSRSLIIQLRHKAVFEKYLDTYKKKIFDKNKLSLNWWKLIWVLLYVSRDTHLISVTSAALSLTFEVRFAFNRFQSLAHTPTTHPMNLSFCILNFKRNE